MTYLRRLTGPAALIALAVLWSNIWGQIRDVLSSSLFQGDDYNAYLLAVNVPFQAPQLISAALAAAMVPVLVDLYRQGRTVEARRVSSGMVLAAVLALAPLALAGVLLSGEVLQLFYWDSEKPATLALATRLSQVLFPYLFISGVSGAIAATLQSREKFRVLALGQLLPNVTIVAAIALFYRKLGITSQAIGVVLGGIAYLLLLLPYVLHVYQTDAAAHPRDTADIPAVPWWRLPAARQIFRAMLPVLLIGLADWATGQWVVFRAVSWVQQVHSATSKEFNNAYRVLQIPQGLFVAAMATVLLPLLSRHAADDDRVGLAGAASAGIRMVLFVVAPTAAALSALALPILTVLFRHGVVTGDMARASASLVQAMAPYVLFSSIAEVLILSLLAMKRVWSLLAVQVISFIAAAGILWKLSTTHGLEGIALAVSVVALLNLGLLFWAVERHIQMHDWKEMTTFLWKLGIACSGMWLALSFLSRSLEGSRRSMGMGGNILEIGLGVVVAGVVYILLSEALHIREWLAVRNVVVQFLRGSRVSE